jgi:hypothetical protein
MLSRKSACSIQCGVPLAVVALATDTAWAIISGVEDCLTQYLMVSKATWADLRYDRRKVNFLVLATCCECSPCLKLSYQEHFNATYYVWVRDALSWS